LLVVASLRAADLPAIPPSDKILTVEQVKNYWLNAIPKTKLPAKGNGLHPEQQAARAQAITRLRTQMTEIKQGRHDIDARVASLVHNVDAYTKLGEEEKAKMAEERLFALREHLSKLATLEVQRDTARKLGEATDRIASLEREINTLQQTISSQACMATCD
jgi:ubiquinone biosynthesis protein Coq4